MNEFIYLDNAATTRLSPEVITNIKNLTEEYGNPSSIYCLGRKAKSIVTNARDSIASHIGCESSELFFTSSGTESDNWAVKGIAFANKDKGKHIITSKIEHHGVLHVVEYLVKEHGFEATYLDVDSDGFISIDELKKSIRKDTILISIMFANNEIGTIQDIKTIGQIAKDNKIYFHTDAVQALGYIKMNMKELNIDLASFSAHKLHGPKGVGALYIKTGTRIHNLIHGGAQERRKRASTENVIGISSFAIAVNEAYDKFNEKHSYLIDLRDYCISRIMNEFEHVILNGSKDNRLSKNVNISFLFIEGESMLLALDMKQVCASSGSACTSGSLDPSHVLMALGLTHEKAHGSLRISLSKYSTKDEIDYLVDNLKPIITRLREMSPLYEEISKGN